jgi:hypothetical protein
MARVDAFGVELAASKNSRDSAVQRLTSLEEIEEQASIRLAEVVKTETAVCEQVFHADQCPTDPSQPRESVP